MQDQTQQAEARPTDFDDEVVDAFVGIGMPSLRARQEVLYYYFSKVLGMSPDQVNRMHPLRVRAWFRIIRIELQLEEKKAKLILSVLTKG